jgi:hypothetical protein
MTVDDDPEFPVNDRRSLTDLYYMGSQPLHESRPVVLPSEEVGVGQVKVLSRVYLIILIY